MMDVKLIEDVQRWLASEPSSRSIQDGALMLLKMNRNRILYNNVIANPAKFEAKLEYELNKLLKMRLANLTVAEVVEMDKQVIPAAKATLDSNNLVEIDAEKDVPHEAKIAKGKRADHEELPKEIQNLWEQNGERYFKIKHLFETLKTMENAQPCDRYEYLQQLSDLDKQYRAAMQQYDEYQPGDATISHADQEKKVNAARKYLSENKNKLANYRAEHNMEKAQELLIKMQKRYDFLVQNGYNLDAAQVAALSSLGVNTIK